MSKAYLCAMKKLALLLFLPLIFACNSSSEKEEITPPADEETAVVEEVAEEDYKLRFIGDWEALWLNILVDNDGEIDEIFVFQKDFPLALGIQNNYTTYYDDGTLKSRYVGLDGEVIMEENAKWEITADSLFIQSDGDSVLYKYSYVVNGDTGFWETYVDWDGDGNQDDFMRGASLRSTNWIFSEEDAEASAE